MRYKDLFLPNVEDARITGEQLTGRCPFHKENNPSFSANLRLGVWQCFGCHLSGNAKRFKQLLGDKTGGSLIPDSIVKEYHHNLMNNKMQLEFLKEKRGLTVSSIKKFKLGHDGRRFTIPIYDRNGLVNVRRYKPNSKGADKMISFAPGYGQARLFPMHNLRFKTILLCEGELDCIIACQYRFNAITVTSGAGVWSDEFTPLFKLKHVIICFDIDKTGRDGAQRIAKILKSVVTSIRLIDLPMTEPPGADLTNYLVDLGHEHNDLKELILKTSYVYEKEKGKKDVKLKCTDTSLAEAANHKYYFKPCRFDTHVAGKALSPFIVPRKVVIKCDRGKSICNRCRFNLKHDEDALFVIEPDDPFLLSIIDVSSKRLKQLFKEMLEVHDSCKSFNIDVIEAMNVQEVRMIPTITYSIDPMAHEHVIRQGFCTKLDVLTNTAYVMEALTVPHPKDQHVTHLIFNASTIKDDVNKFKLNDNIIRRLRQFQPKEDTKEAIYKKLTEMNNDLAYNVTHIYKRDDLLTALNLVYHSILRFKFQGRMLTKGWLEALILGDTRTGKTETVTRLIEHLKAGELVTGENVSFAGLVGGLQQVSGQWMITWGKLPLNSGRLLVVDEMSALPVEIIERLSDVRSRGIAEITKIETEKTTAMTRLIWLSNARSASALNSYDTGVMAVKELIGKPEDVARLDLVLTVASGEVPLSVINTVSTEKVKHKFTSEVCHDSVMFAWSRRPEHVKILKPAEHKILMLANQFAKKYSPQIPLVEPAEQRNKLAKIAVALACLLYSTKTGDDVVVRAVHAEVAAELLMSFYDKPSLGYDVFSKQFIVTDIKQERLINALNRYGQAFAEHVLNTPYLTLSDFEDFANISRQEAKLVISELVINGAIRRKHGYYLKTPAFITLLKDALAKGKIKQQKSQIEESL